MRKILAYSVVLSSMLFADTRLEKSVISTTGFEESLADEVRNVNVITKEDIQKRSESSLKEVLNRAPGVNFLKNAFGESIDLRGQGDKANTNVQIMVNGVAMNTTDSSHTAMPLDAFNIDDIEKIEIIPGGGSVLYGSGTQGGVINIITKTKPRDFYANISSKYKSGGSLNGAANIGGMVSDKLFLKSSLYAYKDDGYRYHDEIKGVYGSLGFEYFINDNQNLSLNASHYSGENTSAGGVTKKILKENRRSTDGKASKTDVKMTNLTADYSVKFNNNWQFKITPFYQKTEFDPGSGSGFEDEKYGARSKFRYDYKFGNLIFGYDYIYNEGKNDGSFDFIIPGRRGTPSMRYASITKGSTKKTTNSFFLQNKFDFTDRFSLTAGYRYDHAKYKIGKYTNTKIGPAAAFNRVNPMINTLDLDKSENNYAFEITPNFKYSDTGNLYLKYERGFTSPSANKMQNKDKFLGYYPSNIKSETFQTYEVGMKDLLFGHFFQASVFYTKSKDEIATTGAMPTWWKQHNIGETSRWGIELYSEQNLVDDSLRLSQSFTYIDTEIKKAGSSNFKEGEEVPNVPKYKVALGVDYDITKNLTLFVDSVFYGDQKNSSAQKISSYNLTNIGARVKYKNLTITGGIDNVFDKEYYNFVSGRGDNAIYYAGDGRTYYMELKYDF